MKYSIMSVVAAAALTLSLGSCDDKLITGTDSEASGSLSFASMSVDVSVAENVMRHAHAAEGSRAGVDVSDFIVTVSNSAGAVVEQWKYRDMPELMTLPVATGYTVSVKSHEVQKAEWSRPYYTGSKSFDITEGTVTEIGEVRCSFSNIKVTIKYDPDFLKELGDDANVNVIANDEGSLDFSPSETRSGYFEAVNGSSTLVATFTGTVKGHPERIQRVLTDVAAGQHRILTFKMKSVNIEPDPETGTIAPEGFTVDMDVVEEDLNGNVATDEEVITPEHTPDGDEDFGNDDDDKKDPTPPGPEDPKSGFDITSEGNALSFDAPNTPAEGMNGLINIHSELPIAHLRVNISTTNASFESAVGEMVGLAFDLAYPDESKNETAKFSGLGFPVGQDVIGKTDLPFNITDFIPLLGAFSGTHDFKITVEDNAGGSISKTLTFVAE